MRVTNKAHGKMYLLAFCSLLMAASVHAEEDCYADSNWPSDQTLKASFDVLSWNLQKASGDGWQRDLKELAGDVELAFLQEASLQAGIPELLPGALTAVFAEGYTTTQLNTGVMTLGTAAPSKHCSFSAVEPWLRTPKAASAATYALSGRDEHLLAINLHAVNFSLGLDSLRNQLLPLLQQVANHTGPAIIAGDFNTWSEARQNLVDELLAAQGLTQVEFEDDKRSRPLGRPLDHVYLRGLTVEKAEVISVASSDHNPIRLRLALVP
ncbi:MAG: endonuclease/exonuclease/phosphatase family protein [Pseudomonadota bacterium]